MKGSLGLWGASRGCEGLRGGLLGAVGGLPGAFLGPWGAPWGAPWGCGGLLEGLLGAVEGSLRGSLGPWGAPWGCAGLCQVSSASVSISGGGGSDVGGLGFGGVGGFVTSAWVGCGMCGSSCCRVWGSPGLFGGCCGGFFWGGGGSETSGCSCCQRSGLGFGAACGFGAVRSPNVSLPFNRLLLGSDGHRGGFGGSLGPLRGGQH